MKSLLKLIFLFLLQICFSVQTPIARRGIPVPPADDPFYTPSAGWESLAPGSIIKSRPLPNAIGILILQEKVNEGYQILYRTTDAHGNPSYTVTTVLVPYNPDYTKVIQYHIAEDADWSECAPSYAMQAFSNIQGVNTQIEVVLITIALNLGVIVVVPNYEGPKNAFGAGIVAGQAALDSVRAVLQSTNITGVSANAKFTFQGYSGASIPVGHAAQLESSYAPDLEDVILGYAAGGVVANLTAVGINVNGGVFSGFVPDIIMGMGKEYPEVLPFVQSQVSADWWATFQKYTGQCMVADLLDAPFFNIFDVAADGEAFFTNDVIAPILDENLMGLSVPVKPVYLYQSQNDEIIPPPIVTALQKKWCSEGAVVVLHEDLLSEHITEMIFGYPGALKWQYDLLRGTPPPTACSVTEVINNAFNEADIAFIGLPTAELLLELIVRWPVGDVLDI